MLNGLAKPKRLADAAWQVAGPVTSIVKRLIFIFAFALVVSLLLEGASRLMHFGVRPMLPFVTDNGLAPRLPPHFGSTVRFPGRGDFEVCTDGMGARQATCDASDAPIRTVVAGDSQVLGWGFSFSDTFAARVALHFGASPPQVRVIAAGGADVESLRPWASDFTKQCGHSRADIKIVAVNLGNDLDEMYFGRATGRIQYLKTAFEWLNSHSYLMLDYTIAKRIFLGEPWGLPPGANPVLFALDDNERTQLALATAEATSRLAAALPESDRSIVVIFPADYQIDIRQFEKYRKFYPSESQFNAWSAHVPEASRRLDQIESVLRARLAASGLTTISLKEILKGSNIDILVDSSSHHLTVEGHKMVAQAIVDALKNAIH